MPIFRTNIREIMKIKNYGKFRNISLLSVYGPTEDADDSSKEEFYDTFVTSIEITLMKK